MNAAFIAIGMEATVYVYDRSIDRLRELDIGLRRPRRPCYARRWTSSSACPSRPRDRRGARPSAPSAVRIRRDQLS